MHCSYAQASLSVVEAAISIFYLHGTNQGAVFTCDLRDSVGKGFSYCRKHYPSYSIAMNHIAYFKYSGLYFRFDMVTFILVTKPMN